MAWDDVVIGKGHSGNSAIRVFSISGEHGISHNSSSFWISDAYLDIGMTIMKDTPEGKKLSRFIDEKFEYAIIEPWLKGLVLKRVDPERLVNAVQNAIDSAYIDGSLHAQNTIREALGLRN